MLRPGDWDPACGTLCLERGVSAWVGGREPCAAGSLPSTTPHRPAQPAGEPGRQPVLRAVNRGCKAWLLPPQGTRLQTRMLASAASCHVAGSAGEGSAIGKAPCPHRLPAPSETLTSSAAAGRTAWWCSEASSRRDTREPSARRGFCLIRKNSELLGALIQHVYVWGVGEGRGRWTTGRGGLPGGGQSSRRRLVPAARPAPSFRPVPCAPITTQAHPGPRATVLAKAGSGPAQQPQCV